MINESGTGIYIAYPRTAEFRIAHDGPGTLVNHGHTKVGVAAHSFRGSASECRQHFDGKIKFIPLVEIPPGHLREVERKVIAAVSRRFARVGAAPNWFDTQDREAIISLIYALLSPAANETTVSGGEAFEKAGG